MRTHLPQFLSQEDWQRLPEPHRTQIGDWLLEHGYRSLPWCSDEAWMEEIRRRTPPQVDATALLHWLDERLPVNNIGVTRFSEWWESHWLTDDGGMMSYAAPTPVLALWAAVLRVLEVEG